MRFAIKSSAGTEQVINSSVTTPIGDWVHVAVVLTGITGILYLNGLQVGNNDALTLTPAGLGTTNQNYLGKSQWDDPYLDASLDDFRIYSRAMSSGEVNLFASTLAPPGEFTATSGFQQVMLTWEAVANAATYRVQSSTSPDGIYTTVAASLTETSFSHTGLSNGVPRYYTAAHQDLGN